MTSSPQEHGTAQAYEPHTTTNHQSMALVFWHHSGLWKHLKQNYVASMLPSLCQQAGRKVNNASGRRESAIDNENPTTPLLRPAPEPKNAVIPKLHSLSLFGQLI